MLRNSQTITCPSAGGRRTSDFLSKHKRPDLVNDDGNAVSEYQCDVNCVNRPIRLRNLLRRVTGTSSDQKKEEQGYSAVPCSEISSDSLGGKPKCQSLHGYDPSSRDKHTAIKVDANVHDRSRSYHGQACAKELIESAYIRQAANSNNGSGRRSSHELTLQLRARMQHRRASIEEMETRYNSRAA